MQLWPGRKTIKATKTAYCEGSCNKKIYRESQLFDLENPKLAWECLECGNTGQLDNLKPSDVIHKREHFTWQT